MQAAKTAMMTGTTKNGEVMCMGSSLLFQSNKYRGQGSGVRDQKNVWGLAGAFCRVGVRGFPPIRKVRGWMGHLAPGIFPQGLHRLRKQSSHGHFLSTGT
jgi:hypothetical protein